MKFIKNNIYLILVVVLSLPVIWALFHKGFYGASDDLHIAWLFEMDKVIKLGQIPPRFVPDLSFGFGYPLFNFVFPLPFYLGEVFHLLSFSFVDSVKIVFGISLLGSAVAMYLFLKEFLSKEVATLGALIYLYTPYRSTDVYIRGAIGEALSFLFLPIIMYGIIKIARGDKKFVSVLALGIAGLILSHNIVSYMFFPFLLVFILMFFSWRVVLGTMLGLLISLYFWLPAISESRLMQYGTVFNFADHFPTIRQLIIPYFGYGASVAGPYDGMSFFVGLINLIVIIGGSATATFYWKKFKTQEKKIMAWGLIVLTTSVFMMNFRSSFLWKNLPLLPYFQFPWRFLTMVTFSSVLFLIPLNYIKGVWRYLWVLGLIALVVILNVGFFKPHDFLEREDAYYINRYIPVPEASKDYLETQEEYLRLPLATEKRPDMNYPIVSSREKFNYTVIQTDGMYSKIEINTPNEIALNYNKYYFPGWAVKIDDEDAIVRVGKPFGQVEVNVPKGNHVLEFSFKETKYRLILDIISAGALLSALLILLKKT
jgi:hypothetical protein